MNIDYKELLNGYKNNETVTYIQGAIITYNKGVKAMEKLLEEKEALYNKITTRDNSSYSNIDEYATRIVEINTELSLCNEEIAKSLKVMEKGGLSINNKSEEIVKKAEAIIEAEPKKIDVVIKDVKKAKEKTSKNIKLKDIDKMKTAELIDICKDHKFKGYTAYRSKSDVEKLRQFVKNKLKEERKQARVDTVVKDEVNDIAKTPVEPEAEVVKEVTTETINPVVTKPQLEAELPQSLRDEKAKHIFNAVPNVNKAPIKSDEPLFKNIDKYDDELNKMRAEQIKNAKNSTELGAIGVTESRIKNYSEIKKEAIKHRVIEIKKVPKETADKIFGMLKSGKAKIAQFGTKTLDFIKERANVIKTNITENKEFFTEHAKEASNVVKEKANDAADWVKYQAQDTGRVMADIGASIGLMASEIPEDIKKAGAQAQSTVTQKTEPIRNAFSNTVEKVKSKIDIPQPISLVDENEVKEENKAESLGKVLEEMTPEQKQQLQRTYLAHLNNQNNVNENLSGEFIDGYPIESNTIAM